MNYPEPISKARSLYEASGGTGSASSQKEVTPVLHFESAPRRLRGNKPPRGGFALLIALVLMGFILLLLVSLSSLVMVETSTAGATSHLNQARANALLGIQVALSELQQTMGPDQRVSFNAEILENTQQVDPQKRHMVGVWNTENWDFSAPDVKPPADFLGWLISSNNGGTYQRNENLDYATASPLREVLMAGEGSAGTNIDEWVYADKIPLSGDNEKGAFAFWISDEGQKATLGLPGADGFASLPVIERQRLFQAAPDLDIGSISGLQSLERDTLSEELLLATEQLPLLDASNALANAFKDLYHDVTVYSQGLLTNTKDGGLKEDLNLLFELNDNHFYNGEYGADAPSNLRIVETSNLIPNKRSHRATYAFNQDGLNLVGPSWAVLRSYYRQYLEIEDASDGFSINAQEREPRFSTQGMNVDSVGLLAWYVNPGETSDYSKPLNSPDVARPRSSKLTPVILRYQVVVSVQAVPYAGPWEIPVGTGSVPATHALRLILTPVFVLWNPYGAALEIEGFAAHSPSILPLEFDWLMDYNGNGVSDIDATRHPFASIINSSDFHRGPISTAGGGYTLRPGEVRVFSPDPSNFQEITNTNVHIDLVPGLQLSGGFYTDTLLPDSFHTAFFPQGTLIDYHYNGPGPEPAREKRLLLSEPHNTGFAINTKVGSVTSVNWWQQLFLYGYLIHEGQTNNRHMIGIGHPGTVASRIQGQGVIPGRNGMGSLIGDIGRQPLDEDTFFYATAWAGAASDPDSPVIALGVIDMLARAADDGTVKPMGPHNPAAWVNTTPWIHNRYGETMLGAYDFKVSSLPNHSFSLMDHEMGTARSYWGNSYTFANHGQHFVPMYQVPHAPIWSLGALQHAHLGTFAFEPSHVLGNSFAPTIIPQSNYLLSLDCRIDSSARNTLYGDTSYLTNISVWDGYFFSSLAPEASSLFANPRDFRQVVDDIPDRGLPNARIVLTGDYDDFREAILRNNTLASDAYRKAARHLAIDGAFNINSSSVEAWKALLSGMRNRAIEYTDNGASTTDIFTHRADDPGTIIPRSTYPAGPEGDLFSGFRNLSDADVDELAIAIVSQVKQRGPFLTLAQFVNRYLTNSNLGLSGTLQAAIDATDINDGFRGDDIGVSAVSGFPNHNAASGDSATGASANLTQADILQAIAPFISARSDTFKIRAYGSVEAPYGGANQPLSEAWCEAIVQRTIDYVDPSANDPGDGPDAIDASGVNDRFGRKFRVLHFRWLSESEL